MPLRLADEDTGDPVDADCKLIVNLTRGTVACDQVIVADRPARRMRGLLGRQSLPAGEGMLLQPAPSVHTAFMRFPIDVVFMDGTLQVVKVVEQLPPWRTASARRAKATLELAAGEAARRTIAIGDRLGVLEVPQEAQAGARSAGISDSAERSHADRGVTLVSQDRRFRAVAAALLSQRGCAVVLADRGAGLTELARRDRTHVVVFDVDAAPADAAREAARLAATDPHAAIVLVGDEPEEARHPMPVLAKWGAFDRLYEAIQNARRGEPRRASHG